MESIKGTNLARLLGSNGASTTGTARRLTAEQFEHLSALCRQMAAFYPHQELAAETVRGFLDEFEGLAAKHGIDQLERAFRALRSKPGQRFFPHPSEVAEQIEEQIEAARETRAAQAQSSRAAHERQADIDNFWNEFLPDRIARFGWTEEEGLRRFPSMRGTKHMAAGNARADDRRVVEMPNRKRGATADRDDVA